MVHICGQCKNFPRAQARDPELKNCDLKDLNVFCDETKSMFAPIERWLLTHTVTPIESTAECKSFCCFKVEVKTDD
jgi:hypothetical protein